VNFQRKTEGIWKLGLDIYSQAANLCNHWVLTLTVKQLSCGNSWVLTLTVKQNLQAIAGSWYLQPSSRTRGSGWVLTLAVKQLLPDISFAHLLDPHFPGLRCPIRAGIELIEGCFKVSRWIELRSRDCLETISTPVGLCIGGLSAVLILRFRNTSPWALASLLFLLGFQCDE